MTIRSPFVLNRVRSRSPRLLFTLVVILALFITLVFVASAQNKRQSKRVTRRPSKERPNKQSAMRRERERERANEPIEEDVEGRENWFWHQRMYPFDELPEDGRERAWAARPIDKNIKPEVLTWQPLGPVSTTHQFVGTWGATSGRVSAIAISPTNANLVLIGSPTGGIWRSTDGR